MPTAEDDSRDRTRHKSSTFSRRQGSQHCTQCTFKQVAAFQQSPTEGGGGKDDRRMTGKEGKDKGQGRRTKDEGDAGPDQDSIGESWGFVVQKPGWKVFCWPEVNGLANVSEFPGISGYF